MLIELLEVLRQIFCGGHGLLAPGPGLCTAHCCLAENVQFVPQEEGGFLAKAVAGFCLGSIPGAFGTTNQENRISWAG